jgi:hypothetical protein
MLENLVARQIFCSPHKGGSVLFGTLLQLLPLPNMKDSFLPVVLLVLKTCW